ncbi:MAG TPA: carboxypeptidase regulatory-like domain-containing protein [Terriglobales bacterium]|nr:carboxypeptidase regulatory-like domain-containing protein [Terriglobales bacterium]
MNRLSVFLSVLLLLLIGCSQNTRPMPETSGIKQPAQGKLTVVDPATAGSIHGVVHFTGNAPPPVQIDMGMDPGCTMSNPKPNFSQQYLVNGRRLANVYVYVKQGLEGKNFAVPSTPVILDQKGCRYEPHVLALMNGQTLEVHNSDLTMHNVHAQPNAPSNPQWNRSQMPKGAPIETTFHDPEVMMPFKCNQHPWMKAYVNVAANPFYAVSDSSGEFEIRSLPPGEYTIAAVHEALGEQTQSVTVRAKDSKAVEFTFASQ